VTGPSSPRDDLWPVITGLGFLTSPAVGHWDTCCTPLGLRALCCCLFISVGQWRLTRNWWLLASRRL